jgi:isopentenyldiphosphate isomerase
MPLLSYLDLMNICDNARAHTTSPVTSEFDAELYIPFCLDSTQNSPIIGLLRPSIVEMLQLENRRDGLDKQPFLFTDSDVRPRVCFQDWIKSSYVRTKIMRAICERWRDEEVFPDVCGKKKWRGEMYPVYKKPFGVHDHPTTSEDVPDQELNYAFELERSACALFGIVTYGVHMSIYEQNGRDMKIWTPTRAKSKQTWGGYLDNSVAGGIPSGMGMFESLVKESMEEASIPEDIVRKHAYCTGAISYFFRTSTGWLQPEIEYIYDLRIPSHTETSQFQPKPNDGEVECFELLSHEDCITRMREGKFKPNCALAVIDLLIRLGHINPDNEPDFMEINTRLHGRFDYESW